MTSTGDTRGFSANQKPILKQRNECADLTGNCPIFFLVSFDPKFLAMFENFAHFLSVAEMQNVLILLLQREIILDLDLKSSAARQKVVSFHRKCLHNGKSSWQPGCYYVNNMSIQIFVLRLYAYFKR